ncbi:glutamate 5-kinase [Candidatus Neomarinimicrobiota bacterium]
MREEIASAKKKRIIVKIGSHVLSNAGRFTSTEVHNLAEQIMELREQQHEILLVTSGAVLMGRNMMGYNLSHYPRSLKQTLAAIGQVSLMSAYHRIFEQHNQQIGQILINLEDFNERWRYLNIKQTILGLFKLQVLPVINENDCISTEDFAFGDNDSLSAQLAGMLDADLLVILSTVNGLYNGNPRHEDSKVLSTVKSITPALMEDARSKGQLLSTGGMIAKLEAIKKATHFGVPVILANGKEHGMLRKILAGREIGTMFLPEVKRMRLRKRWLAYSTKVAGEIVIDEGAVAAILDRSASLLSSGVIEVRGSFEAQDVILIVDRNDRKIAKGITKYDSRNLEQVAGLSHNEITRTLGVRYFSEVVHRDDMVLLPETHKEIK